MKKDWILANVLIIVLGFSGILLSLKGHEEKDFLFSFSMAERFGVVSEESGGVEIRQQVVEIKGVVPFNSINLSAFNITKRLMLPAGPTIWKANMVINKFPDGHITSGMAMQYATFFDSLSLDRHRNMAMNESLENPTTSSLDIINQIELQKVFYDLVMFGRFLYLMLIMVTCLIVGNLGIWFFFRQRREKEDRIELIDLVREKIESKPFEEIERLANNHHDYFTLNDLAVLDRVADAIFHLAQFEKGKLSLNKMREALDNLDFDLLFLQVTVTNQRVQARLDVINYGNLHASYSCMQNKKPEQGTVVREVSNLRPPLTPGGISPRDKFNELKKRIDALFAKMSQFKMSDQPQLVSYERGVIEKIRSKLEKLNEVMLLISEELTRSGDRVKLKRFDYVENRIGAAELSFEALEQSI